MYQKDDTLIYGSAGVFRVADITMKTVPGASEPRAYYTLEPLYAGGTVYAPVEGGKICMRSLMSAQQVHDLMDTIPSIEPEVFQSRSMQELERHYSAQFDTHCTADLLMLVLSVYAKKQAAELQRRKVGQVDEKFMKRAQNLLQEEFATTLNIPITEVVSYVASRVDTDENKYSAALYCR